VSLQDYYAAAIALFGIILFAKFASHGRAKWPKGLAWVLHVICIITAVIGVFACFAVLGWGEIWGITGHWWRGIVAITAGIAGFILALEVGFTQHSRPSAPHELV
jgi:hypothetical protein